MGMTRAAYWDGEAASYDRSTAFFEKRLFAEARAWIADRVEGNTLEVGSGTGANLPYYASRATDVTLADVSGEMLAAASARARDLGVTPRTLHGDGAHLDLPDDAFDTMICTFIMCCVEDERAVLRELARVLKPGGRLLMADHVESSTRLGRSVQWVLDVFTPKKAAEHHRRRPILLLPEAGLRVTETTASRWRLVERVAATKPETPGTAATDPAA